MFLSSRENQTLTGGVYPLADPKCFGRPPRSPNRNHFRVGQKLEAIDMRNPALLCPATIKEIYPDGKMVRTRASHIYAGN